LLLKPDGNGKLSKRDGENGGFPVFPLAWEDSESGRKVIGFREEGYFPEAVLNFLAFLGWNPGTTQELFTMDELIQTFTIERVGQIGTKFDIQKANWFNRQYLLQKSDEELAGYLMADLAKMGIECTLEYATAVCGLVKDRCTFAKDFYKESAFMFAKPSAYDEAVVASKWNEDAKTVLTGFMAHLIGNEAITADEARHAIHEVADAAGIKAGKVMQGIRLAITGLGAGPDLMLAISLLGRREVLGRIEQALKVLN
jgi:glutamyl-tRNA synthetase